MRKRGVRESVREWSGTPKTAKSGDTCKLFPFQALGCQVFRFCGNSSPGPLVSEGTRSFHSRPAMPVGPPRCKPEGQGCGLAPRCVPFGQIAIVCSSGETDESVFGPTHRGRL